MTKHEAMRAYFEPIVTQMAQEKIRYNYAPDIGEAISFITNYSARVVKSYVRGAEKEYTFSIILDKAYSSDLDGLNMAAMNFAQGLMDWVDAQNKLKNFPQFPDNCTIKKIENLQNMPNLAGVNADEGLARYMVQCRVLYYEEER